MDHLAEVELAERQGKPQPGAPPALQSSGYGQGREQPPIRSGAIYLDQVTDTGSTGYLFSQPIVTDASADEFRLDELLGKSFALVVKNNDALTLSDRSANVLKQLDANIVNVEGLNEVRGHFDRALEESDAVIVRPDRIVFGHTTNELSLDQLIETLSDKLALTN